MAVPKPFTGEAVEDLVRSWAASHLAATLGVVWCGPLARGHPDPGGELRLQYVLNQQDYGGGRGDGARRPVRDAFRGHIICATPSTFEEMASWSWTPELRFDFGTARLIHDPEQRLSAFLRQHVEIPGEQRRAETLERYTALRGLWRGLMRHMQRGDHETGEWLVPLIAEAGMRLYFTLHEVGTPSQTWLFPEFRRLAPEPWRHAVLPLVTPSRQPATDRAAAAHLVELTRDEIHEVFHISRGALDSWEQGQRED